MTANANRKLPLDEVLDNFSGLSGPPDATTLRAWTKEYPEYERELVAFATDWVAMEAARVERVVTAEDVDVVVNRTMSRVQAVLDAAERPETLTDLAADMIAAGHDFESFQRSVGIDRSILDSLVMRLAKPATVPTLLVRLLAGALNRPVDALRGYFRLPPQLAAAHKSRTRPAPTQVDFAMLVQHSQLSELEKDRWLREPPDPGLQD
jgi:nucleotide-binding universal stress UspA family protein